MRWFSSEQVFIEVKTKGAIFIVGITNDDIHLILFVKEQIDIRIGSEPLFHTCPTMLIATKC
jgi:hypothetical protein